MIHLIIFYILFAQLSFYLYLDRYHKDTLYEFIDCLQEFCNQIKPGYNFD